MPTPQRVVRFPLSGLWRASALCLVLAVPGPARQDVERATHADEAATPQLSFEEHVGDFVIRQYQLGCLSQLTYLMGSRDEAVVVDPQRDVGHYLRDAEELGLEIRYVLLTHTNADFVAGHTELAAQTGAEVLISAESDSRFPHRGLVDGDRVEFGDASLELWATPGHTLDSMTALVHVPGAAVDPAYALTGDTLFIGGVGRPDLMGGDVTPVVLAESAFDSMQRLSSLPGDTQVLPAHGAGSLCGAHLSPDTVSTIERERSTNPYLMPMSRAAFVSRVISGLPVAPQYFRYNAALNREGPPVVDWTAELPPALSAADVRAKVEEEDAWVVDLRDADRYAAAHVPGSVNIAVRGRLDTWTGIAVPFEASLVLVGDEEEVREAAYRFRRIGIDGVSGYLKGGVDAWRAAGFDVRSTELLTPHDLAERIAAGTEPFLVDVRTPDEYAELRVGDYANIPVTEWQSFGRVLDKRRPVVFLCNSAYRSSMAAGLAERQGFEHVAGLGGGLDAWLDEGLPVVGTAPICALPADGAEEPTSVRALLGLQDDIVPMALPEALEPQSLARGLMDQPRLYAILDVRPRWQFDEYHVPGAVHVTPEDVAAILREQSPTMRTVIVDRDGTLAFAVAGAALRELGERARTVRALVGGTSAYWRQIELGERAPGPESASVRSVPIEASAPVAPSPAPVPDVIRKRRKAGC